LSVKKIGLYLDQILAPYFNLLFSANHTAAKPRSNIRHCLQSIILYFCILPLQWTHFCILPLQWTHFFMILSTSFRLFRYLYVTPKIYFVIIQTFPPSNLPSIFMILLYYLNSYGPQLSVRKGTNRKSNILNLCKKVTKELKEICLKV